MLATAFLLGLGGSLHCMGMCSPLAAAVANRSKGSSTWWLYQSGRILVYSILGSVVATFGYLLPIQSIQNTLSLAMGGILILIGILGARWLQSPKLNRLLTKVTTPVKTLFATQIQRKSHFSIFILGAINGLLPCGLTLAALVACIIAPSPAHGFIFMATFGAGTLPALFGAKPIQWLMKKQIGFSYRTLNSILLIVAGALLVGRAIHTHQHHSVAATEMAPVCED